MRDILELLFSFKKPLGRKAYFLSGLALMALKYAGDVLFVWIGTRQLWDPFDYQSSILALTSGRLKDAPPALLVALAIWAIPFLWLGVTLSARRAIDIGWSPWLSLIFFVPGLKYVMFIGLSVNGSGTPKPDAPPRSATADLWQTRLIAGGVGIAIGLAMIGIGVYFANGYGAALFLGTPFVIGAVSAFILNSRRPSTSRETQTMVAGVMAILAGVVIALAFEGLVCLIMVAPIAFGLGYMGAYFGREIALFNGVPVRGAYIGMAALPLAAIMEGRTKPTELREVKSSVEIAAPADVVWRNVIAFSPLPEPDDIVFRSGIAYPMRAEIVGSGVGAIRHCVFSTGEFVEPITRWEPGHRLSFNVASQPDPLRELSPYRSLRPPHVDGYFQSRRGEFRLVALPNGHTLLEGSTWYEMRLQPAFYWALFSDALIHRIHGRVLDHIRVVSEEKQVGKPGS